jgi:hypothetical protein
MNFLYFYSFKILKCLMLKGQMTNSYPYIKKLKLKEASLICAYWIVWCVINWLDWHKTCSIWYWRKYNLRNVLQQQIPHMFVCSRISLPHTQLSFSPSGIEVLVHFAHFIYSKWFQFNLYRQVSIYVVWHKVTIPISLNIVHT